MRGCVPLPSPCSPWQVPHWPAMPASQILHTAEDRRLWLRQRRPWMEYPSRYLAAMNGALAQRRMASAGA